jgi:hypothetical protein
VESVEVWLASNEAATDQAIRDLDGGAEPAAPTQNPAELAVLVSATRTSAVLAAEAESRCVKELATLQALRAKLLDTEVCKMCPAGSATAEKNVDYIIPKALANQTKNRFDWSNTWYGRNTQLELAWLHNYVIAC